MAFSPRTPDNFNSMMTESLIRAVELRMDKRMAARAKEMIDTYYRSGLLLVPFFYDSLVVYERDQVSLFDIFPGIVLNIQVADEKARFASSFMAIAPQQNAVIAEVPRPAPLPVANPTLELLKQGEAALNAKNNEKAKAAFESVLNNYDRNNGAALYGLALIASREGDHDQAKEYFERTTRSDSVAPSMKVWAYIYLARIFDLDCERPRAIEYYQQAIKLGDNSLNAQASAQEGAKAPYKGGCE